MSREFQDKGSAIGLETASLVGSEDTRLAVGQRDWGEVRHGLTASLRKLELRGLSWAPSRYPSRSPRALAVSTHDHTFL